MNKIRLYCAYAFCGKSSNSFSPKIFTLEFPSTMEAKLWLKNPDNLGFVIMAHAHATGCAQNAEYLLKGVYTDSKVCSELGLHDNGLNLSDMIAHMFSRWYSHKLEMADFPAV